MSVGNGAPDPFWTLGLVFLVFGLNGFLQFIPATMPSGTAGQFVGALVASHYMIVVDLLEIIPAVLLLANRYVPLALTLLAPVIVNIVCYHLFMDPGGLPVALVVAVLWMLVAWQARSVFTGILQQRVSVIALVMTLACGAALQTNAIL